MAAGLHLRLAPEEGEIETRNAVDADCAMRPADDFVVRREGRAGDTTCRKLSGLDGADGAWAQPDHHIHHQGAVGVCTILLGAVRGFNSFFPVIAGPAGAATDSAGESTASAGNGVHGFL